MFQDHLSSITPCIAAVVVKAPLSCGIAICLRWQSPFPRSLWKVRSSERPGRRFWSNSPNYGVYTTYDKIPTQTPAEPFFSGEGVAHKQQAGSKKRNWSSTTAEAWGLVMPSSHIPGVMIQMPSGEHSPIGRNDLWPATRHDKGRSFVSLFGGQRVCRELICTLPSLLWMQWAEAMGVLPVSGLIKPATGLHRFRESFECIQKTLGFWPGIDQSEIETNLRSLPVFLSLGWGGSVRWDNFDIFDRAELSVIVMDPWFRDGFFRARAPILIHFSKVALSPNQGVAAAPCWFWLVLPFLVDSRLREEKWWKWCYKFVKKREQLEHPNGTVIYCFI